MPSWIHERAKHISAKNPSMSESQAWAIATQQSHALGKTPKGYGTAEGRREAKEKYTTPKDDKKTANPGNLTSARMDKNAGLGNTIMGFLKGAPAAAAPSSGSLIASGVKKQMAAGRNFGGAAVDPFIKLRQQAASGAKVASPFSSFFDELIQIKLAQFAKSQFSGPIEGPKVAPPTSHLPPMTKPEILVKRAFQTSQFSGPLSMGSFKMTSHQPPFQAAGPQVKVVPAAALKVDPASTSPIVKRAYAGMGTNIPNVSSPKAVLSQTKRVGGAGSTPAPGPSIASQVRPINVGKGSPTGPSLPGAVKS
jgi:hypothetical protein